MKWEILLGLFLILSILLFLVILNHEQDNLKPFNNIWDEKNKKMMIDTLTNIDEILTEMGLEWHAAYGTLLGAIRHHDIIPWDDDVDIYVSHNLTKQISEFKDKLNRRGYELWPGDEYVPYKVYSKEAATILSGDDLGWPFVDIFLLSENERIQTKRVKFGKMKGGIPVPLNYDIVLEKEYGTEWMKVCKSTSYNHREGHSVGVQYTTECDKLTQSLSLRNIPTYVINLDRRQDRWENTQKELQKVGIISQRISAVDASTPEFKKFYSSIPSPKRSLPETACSESHIKVYKKFLKTNEDYALIFEDDIVFPPSTTYEKLNTALNESKDFKLLLLGHCYTSKHSVDEKGSPFLGKGLCAHAYVISRQGAKDILNTYSVREPIDITTQNLCTRTGGFCYITSEVDENRPSRIVTGNGLVYQLASAGSNIPIRGNY